MLSFLYKKDKYQLFESTIPKIEDWPIFRFNKRRREVIKLVSKYTLEKIIEENPDGLTELIAKALYMEQIRMKDTPWPVDPEDEKDFWRIIKGDLLQIQSGKLSKEKVQELEKVILKKIIDRYSEEIAGNFKEKTYRFATIVVPFLLSKLFNSSIRWRKNRKERKVMDRDLTLNDKLKTKGPIELIRDLSKKGTVVVVPTHFSNLDSIIMGWTIKTMGLPAFIYGAGLNLFNTRLFAALMGGLGAYRVDRRKKNDIYIETLKMYSRTAIDNGVHSLFFPGGTRSRYGGIEKKLKLGLLSTTVDVQRENCIRNPEIPRKIFIVPAVINYHFVLEGPSLISQELEQSGKELYFVENDGVSNTYKLIKFFIKFFTVSSEMAVSYGRPMDVFGNIVDENGESIDKYGNKIKLKDYFSFNDEFRIDPQRDNQYTLELSEKIREQFYKINIVFTSHVLAFVAFEIIRKRYNLGIYDLLKIPEEDISINYDLFRDKVENLKKVITEMHEREELDISERFQWNIDDFITHGLENLGLYNEKRPLILNKFGNIVTQDLSLLYFYRNRLEGYGLEKHI